MPLSPSHKTPSASFFIPLLVAGITFLPGLALPPILDPIISAKARELAPSPKSAGRGGRVLEFFGDVSIKDFLMDWLCQRYPDMMFGDVNVLKAALESNIVLAAFYHHFAFVPTVNGVVAPQGQIGGKDRANCLEAYIGGLRDYAWSMTEPTAMCNAFFVRRNFLCDLFSSSVFANIDVLVQTHIFVNYPASNPCRIVNVDLRRALFPLPAPSSVSSTAEWESEDEVSVTLEVESKKRKRVDSFGDEEGMDLKKCRRQERGTSA